jgi:type II secretory pathway pseudopilin PulG
VSEPRPVQTENRDQAGWLMAGLVVVIAIMLIFSAVGFQGWANVVQRDNEAEMIFRAQDLVRAIQRYRKDHGGIGPEKLEELKEPGTKGQYYLRQEWTDPLVEDGKWGLLYTGRGGAIIDPCAPGPTLGGPGGGLPDSIFDKDRKRKRPGRDLQNRAGGRGNQNQGRGEQSTGLRIAGVKSLCEEEPFRLYRNQAEYKLWLFTYLDLEQQAQAPSGENPDLGSGPN